MAAQDVERRVVDDAERLYGEEVARLRLLLEASSTLLGSLSVESILPEVVDLARRTLAADAYALWRHDATTGSWEIAIHSGLATDYVESATAAIRGTAANISFDEPLVVENIAAAESLNPEHREAHAAAGTQSMLVVALRYAEGLLGTLAFYYREPRRFTDAEKSAASLLANLAAAAVGTAELYERQRRLAQDQSFVAEASQLLASSLDYETTLSNVAALAVPRFADWCSIDMVEEDGSISRLAVAHVDPTKVRWADELAEKYPAAPAARYGVPNVVRTRRAELFSEISDELLQEAAADAPELLQILRELGLRSSMCVPLVARDRAVGAITFVSAESGRRYDESDLATAQDVARRAAIAVDNALLFRDAEVSRRQAQESLADAEAVGERLRVLAEASQQLAATLDYETTLANIASLLVPRFADWYAVDVLDDGRRFRRLAIVHKDPEKTQWVEKSQRVYAPDLDEPEGTGRVVRTGEAVLYRSISDDLLASTTKDAGHHEVLRQLGMESAMVVPLTAAGRTFGALMLVSADPNHLYDEGDLEFAKHLGRRVAVAVDNARLYRAAERRARAALVVEHVADGVMLVDRSGVVRLWNPAAEYITGLASEGAVGRSANEVFVRWDAIEPLSRTSETRPTTQAVEINERELWLSITGVGFEGGSVYAFRDLTAERAVEKLKADFVSTISHELRTPLAAIYGAALTLRRDDILLGEAQRSGLLEVVASESERLARIVNDILWASRLESGEMQTAIERCDAVEIARAVVEAARHYVPPDINLNLSAPKDAPLMAADPDKARQVLTNLVDNAVKYSPDGGRVDVEISVAGASLRFFVRDEGLGVPPAEHRRIFEKFYRLDPDLTRGVGGTGLGLYISRELLERMGGRIWVESSGTGGSTFVAELPIAA